MVLKKNRGITLVALVITIIILLVLAGISISALTNTGIFQKTKDAKSASENAEKEQNKILDEYETALDQYDDNTLVYKVNNGTIKIGDYVKYTPAPVTKDDENYKILITNLETYSGSNNNTESTLKQEELNWRVLDIKDGHVRLISAEPTKSKMELKGYEGYNNAVKLLDDTCETLYNSKLASKVQNLKIEDITKKMKKEPTYDSSVYNPSNINYPQILEYEKQQTVNNNTSDKKIEKSEQFNYVSGHATSSKNSLHNTFWKETLNTDSFEKNIYNELFVKKNTNDNFDRYWISSRSISSSSGGADYRICIMDCGNIDAYILCTSWNSELLYNFSFSFRPVITLKSNIQLDTTKTGDGSSAEHAYEIK